MTAVKTASGKYKRNTRQCVLPICSVKTIILCHRVIPCSHLYHLVHMVEQTILFSLLDFGNTIDPLASFELPWIFLLMPSVTNEVSYVMQWTQMTGCLDT